MIVVDPTEATNTISLLPRFYDDLDSGDITVLITNEDTRINLSTTISSEAKSDGFLSFDVTATFVEGVSYRLKVSDATSGLVYFRDKIFATEQNKQNYSIYG